MRQTIEKIFQKFPLLRIYYEGILHRAFELFKIDNKKRVKVMEEDWKNLIILDACRYDYFNRINFIDGKLRKKISQGSHTIDWFLNNFDGSFHDTIYVSGNPQISDIKCKKRLGKIPFFKIENVWDYGWSEEDNLLPPEPITEAAIKLRKTHPEKRMIVHYLQPHWPFPNDSKVSKDNLKAKKRWADSDSLLWKITEKFKENSKAISRELKKRKKGKGGIWDYLGDGLINLEDAKSAYEENLRLVLEEVKGLIEELKEKTIITSDHGNLFGEHYLYGHPRGMRFKELVEIPWLVVEK